MAEYSKLLLSTGGGIISTQQQAEQVQNTASILIGLGGTGIDCIKTIKAAVRERLKPDDPDAVVAEYSHIQFLGVDTDKKSFKKKEGKSLESTHVTARDLKVLDDTEIFDISNAAIGAALSKPKAIELRPELKWLNYKDQSFRIPDLGDSGAGGFRQIGRYMFMDKSNDFMDRVGDMVTRAKRGLTNPDVNIHIFAGLSGGTGSGSFLDACYMVKSVAAEHGATVFGYFFLPDVNLSRIALENRLVRAYIPCNGYAAMQELDYCMRLSENGGSFTQTYKGGKQIKWDGAPVTMCHLICATNTNGDVIPNAYNYAMNVTSEYVMDFLTEPQDTKNFGIRSHLSNYQNQIASATKDSLIGASLSYCILGASCASIPLREINTYLASKLFGMFGDIRSKEPTEGDVQRFAEEAGVGDYDMLMRELAEGAGDDYSIFSGTWKEVRDYGDNDMVLNYTNQTSNKKGVIEKNAKSMSDEKNSNSLISRIQAALVPYIRSINHGPVYAYRMLEAARSHNLLNVIDGLIETNTNRWNQEKFQDRYGEYEMARDDFRRKPNKKRYEVYEWRLEILEKQKRSLALYDQMDKLLKKLRSQVEKVTAGYYLILQRVVGNLLDTFKANSNALETGKEIMTTNDFAEPLMTIDEVKPKLDQLLETINPAGMMSQLMGVFQNNESEWIQEDENAIAKMVNDFFVNTAFHDFANRSITSFLGDKYNTNNDDLITSSLYEDYIKELAEKANPLFAFNTSVWDDSRTGKIGFISVPLGAAPVVAAAKKLHETYKLFDVKESALKDRVYLMQTACALPLGSYKKCVDYENAYFSSIQAGRHYYEGMQDDFFNDWNKLPSLTPASHIEKSMIPHKLKEQLEETENLYETAKETGLLQEDEICKLAESGKVALTAAMETADKALAAVKNGAPTAVQLCKTAIGTLQSQIAALQKEKTGYVLPHGSQADEETIERIRKDFFVDSPAIQEMMREDIQFVQKAEKKVKEVQKALDDGNIENRRIENFCHILFSGIFEFKPLQITYNKEEFGIPTDVILSKMGPEFPYSRVPLYQAFVTYKAMDKDEQKKILEDADNFINNMDAKVIDTLTDLKTKLSPQYNAAMANNAGSYAEAEEIISFIKKVSAELSGMCGMFGIM